MLYLTAGNGICGEHPQSIKQTFRGLFFVAQKRIETKKGSDTIGYAILRFVKHKGANSRPLEAHHERLKKEYGSNPDIDPTRKNLNYHIIEPTQSYYKEMNSRIEQAGCKTRKDSVKFIDTLITASPEFFEGKSDKTIKAFFRFATEFMKQEIGAKNIFSAVVHMDEKTPHMHLCFTPITEDGRLTAKEILGNKKKMNEWQDKFHEALAEKFPSLERGKSAQLTGRKHIPMQLFKEAVYLGNEMEQIQKLLASMNSLNAGKKRDEVINLLSKWIPDIEKFKTQLKKYNTSLSSLKEENKQLAEHGKEDKKALWNNAKEMAMLQSEMHKYKKFYESVPEDIKKQMEVKGKDIAR